MQEFVLRLVGREPTAFSESNPIHVAGIAAGNRMLGRVETVNVCETGSGGVQALSVDHDMTVVADPDFFSSEAHQPLDVVGIGRHSRMLHRLEHHGVSTTRVPEIVGESVDHEPVARFDPATDDRFSLLEITLG